MPRTQLAVQTSKFSVPDTDVAWSAADQANGNYFINTGNEILLYRNDDSSTHTVTITGVADPDGRTGNVTIAVAASKYGCSGFLPPEAFSQRGTGEVGWVYVDIEDGTSGFFAVVQLPKIG